MRIESLPPAGVKCGLEMFEKMEEDSSYFVFVSERVVGTLMSFYYQLGDLTLAKNK